MIRDFMIPDDETINAIISDFTIKPPKKPSWLNVIDDMERTRSSQTVSCSISMPKPDSSICSAASTINCSTRSFYDDDMLDYLLKDITEKKAEEAEELLKKKIENNKRVEIDRFSCKIKNVIFNEPYTIILWKNGEKTIVKCQEGDKYDAEKGFAIAIIKHMFGDTNYFNNIFKDWIKED